MNVKIGSAVGNWLVLDEKTKIEGVYFNTCECICGNVRKVQTWSLNNSKTKGCGCSDTKTRYKYEGVGDLSKSYFNSFKSGRSLKGKYFSEEVTLEFLWELFLKQNKKCALSGLDIILNPRWAKQNRTKGENIQTASIDRIDSTKNYTIDNIQWVHKIINNMKGQSKDSDFIEICKIVAKHNTNDGSSGA